MLESIRKHSKIGMFVLILLVIPSFVLVGIDTSLMNKSPTVARVDGQEITQDEWDQAHRNEADRIRAQQPQIDARLLDSPEARFATLERLVHDRVLQVATRDMRLFTTDERLASELQNIPQIAALRKPDGSLDVEGYRALVGSQGMTPEGFEANLRQNIALNQVLGVVASSSFTPKALSKPAMDAVFQQREVRVAVFDPAVYRSQVQVSDEEMKAYYDAHQNVFRQPEEVSIEYVQLTLDSVLPSVELSEGDLKTYYEQNLASLAQREERRASHILLTVDAGASADERAKVRAKAEELHKELVQSPARFAELAKQYSQDPGSATQGGDLGFFGRGAMVKSFEDAAFALEPKAISPVVESDFGFHIIQLTEVRKPQAPSFESMRPKLEAELREQQAQRKFAEVADTFSNLVYEQPDSLQPVAEQLKLKIERAEHLSPVARPGQGVLSNERLLQALYEPENLNSKRNTEAVEVGTNHLVAARVLKHTPTQTKPFDTVKDEVRERVLVQKSAALAKEAAEAQLKTWEAATDAAAWTAKTRPVVVSREQAHDLPAAVVKGALSVAPESLPAWKGVDLAQDGYALVRVEKIVPPADTAPEQQMQRDQMFGSSLVAAEMDAYYEVLKKRYKVEYKVQRPNGVSAS